MAQSRAIALWIARGSVNTKGEVLAAHATAGVYLGERQLENEFLREKIGMPLDRLIETRGDRSRRASESNLQGIATPKDVPASSRG